MSPGERMVWAAAFARADAAHEAPMQSAQEASMTVVALRYAFRASEEAGIKGEWAADLREMVTGSRQVPALTGAATDLAYRDEGL